MTTKPNRKNNAAKSTVYVWERDKDGAWVQRPVDNYYDTRRSGTQLLLPPPKDDQKQHAEYEKDLKQHVNWALDWRRKKRQLVPTEVHDALKRVKQAFSYKDLIHRLTMKTTDFEAEGTVFDTPDAMTFVYRNQGANVLGVAHRDSVHEPKYHGKHTIDGETFLFAPTVDDRVGTYVVLDLLPKLGIVTDILLTEGEETGRSTARYFDSEKQYNWMFSFDREGTDCVMYEYEDVATRKFVQGYGFDVNFGSFSDICFLEDLKCKGFNFGTGYYASHNKAAFMSPDDLMWQVAKFVVLFNENKDVKMEHVETRGRYGYYGGRYHGSFAAWYDDEVVTRQGESTLNSYTPYTAEPFEDYKCPGCLSIIYTFRKYTTRQCYVCHKRYYYGVGGIVPVGATDEGAKFVTSARCTVCDKGMVLWPHMGGYICFACKKIYSLTDAGTLKLIGHVEECDICGRQSADYKMVALANNEMVCDACFNEFVEECEVCGKLYVNLGKTSRGMCLQCTEIYFGDA